jgi:hypothetical protein
MISRHRMRRMGRAPLVALALIAACKRGSTNLPACPPLQVKFNGKPLTAPTHGLALVEPSGAVLVEMFNHENVTCGELYARKAGGVRDVPDGEVSVGAWAGAREPAPTGVTFNSNTDLHVQRSLAGHLSVAVTTPPARAGEHIALCVRQVVTIPLGDVQPDGTPRGAALEAEITGTIDGKVCPPPR